MKDKKQKDTILRTLIKTFSYRTAVAISIFFAALLLNHSAGFGVKFVILTYTLGYVLFVAQERLWNMVQWGKSNEGDLHRRTIFKTVTWRLFSFVALTTFSILLGLETSEALEWAIVTNILFVFVHYLHERAWNIVAWGKITAAVSAITMLFFTSGITHATESNIYNTKNSTISLDKKQEKKVKRTFTDDYINGQFSFMGGVAQEVITSPARFTVDLKQVGILYKTNSGIYVGGSIQTGTPNITQIPSEMRTESFIGYGHKIAKFVPYAHYTLGQRQIDSTVPVDYTYYALTIGSKFIINDKFYIDAWYRYRDTDKAIWQSDTYTAGIGYNFNKNLTVQSNISLTRGDYESRTISLFLIAKF
jgi:uncharacterized membrane protein